jgi:predicted permease
VLIVSEVALALVLLAGSGLLFRTMGKLRTVDTGFSASNLLTFDLALPDNKYPDKVQTAAFYGRLLARISEMPGVVAAGVNDTLPFSGDNSSGSFGIEGRNVPAGGEGPHANQRRISEGYLAAMRIPVLRGRNFTGSDGMDQPRVAIIDQKLAARYWPNEDPIGKRVRRGGPKSPWYTIVGIVRDVRHSKLEAAETEGTMYISARQSQVNNAAVAIRTAGNPAVLAGPVAAAVREIDPDLPVYDVKTMEERINASMATSQFGVRLLTLFAALATLLAGVGLYGVIAQSVTQRTQEIGVRMALGAQRSSVLTMVIGQGLRMTAVGLAVGCVAALGLARLISTLLYGISPADPLTYAGVAAVLAIAAVAASAVPAYRAMRTDPLEALRHE